LGWLSGLAREPNLNVEKGRQNQNRHNGQPYAGINILSLWASAIEQNFAAPIWMTYRHAVELLLHLSAKLRRLYPSDRQ